MFNSKFSGKKVLVTGHTGFKGSWLCTWLIKLNAVVCGVSDIVPSKPSMFEELNLEDKIQHHLCDIRNFEQFFDILSDFNPDFIFHLAAQPIVSTAYEDPLNTISTNVMGTSVLLEALRSWNQECSAVIITSDKCYENVEWVYGYKETDNLGGKDIYSASKGAAEVVFHAYYESFFKAANSKVRLATGRAGNVIGGGDWAKDRIVVDCMKSWAKGEVVKIRSPNATRPWQHVLEPLSGYLVLATALNDDTSLNGESFNFGPRAEQSKTVIRLLGDLSDHWNFDNPRDAYQVTDNLPFHEASLLKLNCDKALFYLNWEANFSYDECVRMVGEWYRDFYNSKPDMYKLTLDQISDYEASAKLRGLEWSLN